MSLFKKKKSGPPKPQNHGGLYTIAANMLKTTEQTHVKTMMITSCAPKEGKTVTAINIAYAMVVEAGKKVLLIDGSPKAPRIHKLFEVEKGPGFTELVNGEVEPSKAIQKSLTEDLDILSYGSLPLGKLTNYSPAKLKSIFTAIGSEYDQVIFDGPASFGGLDSCVISSAFDGVVMVVECEKTRWEVFQNYKERLNEAGANIIGVVMNKRKYYIPKGIYV